LISDAQVAHEFERGHVVLGPGQQVHGQDQRDSPSLVASKIVPLMTLQWWRQAQH
jgi:hypothetical protein